MHKRLLTRSKTETRTGLLYEKRRKMDQKAILDHEFLVAAYAITWVIQLGYLAWLGLRWRAQKREAARAGRNAH